MCNIHQFPISDLPAPLRQPIHKCGCIQSWVSRQRLLEEMQDKLQKIFFVVGIFPIVGMHHPV